MRKPHIPLALLLCVAVPAFSRITFSSLTLSGDDRLLFSVGVSAPGFQNSYDTLFVAKLGENGPESSPQILTCFPDMMERLNGGAQVQIRNRYGTALYDAASGTLEWQNPAPDLPPSRVPPAPFSVSADGAYYCAAGEDGAHKAEAGTAGPGSLRLVNAETREEIVLSDDFSSSYGDIRALWSPSGNILLYEKDGAVYFTEADEAFNPLAPPEQYRKIGDGTIRSVRWTRNNLIIYIKGDTVYKIDSRALHIRSLLAPLMGNGEICGRLCTSFNPLEDGFWVNGDGTQLAIISNGSIVSLYSQGASAGAASRVAPDYIRGNEAEDARAATLTLKSVFPLPGAAKNAADYEILWAPFAAASTAGRAGDGTALLWADTLSEDVCERVSLAYRLAENDAAALLFTAADSIAPALSPDGARFSFTDGQRLCVYDLASGSTVFSDDAEKVVSVVWDGNAALYAGGEKTLRRLDIQTRDQETILLSSAQNAFWTSGTITSLSEDGRSAFVYNEKSGTWVPVNPSTVSNAVHPNANGRYRVFTAPSPSVDFDNAIYVRSLSGNSKTYSVYEAARRANGEQKRVSLVFDATEGTEGLSKILYTLKKFNIGSTFFLNGEFIRRYPEETRRIAASGAECASMFFSATDLTDDALIIDSAFIREGLARCEDEFFSATGKELSPLWHAPYNRATRAIREAGSEAGYIYVDELNIAESGAGSASAGELVDLYTGALRDGAVIPVNVGRSEGPLYEKLDFLISSILKEGYEIVPAGRL